jgi:YVTN family beta-propeller protein
MRPALFVVTVLALLGMAECSRTEDSRQKGVKTSGRYRTQRTLKGNKKGRGNNGDDDDDEGSDKGDDGGEKVGKKGKDKKDDDDDDDDDDEKCVGTVVVANEGDGTLSILDANLGELLETVEIPWNTFTMLQPVPVDVESVNGIIYVSDSANDRVVAFDGVSYEVVANIAVGDSPAEMSTDARGRQLWVTNTGDNTVLVVDLAFNVVIRSIEAFDPVNSVFGDNIVNDVLLSPSGDAGFVTYSGDGGLVVRFGPTGALEAVNVAVGDQARLASSFRFNCLYVPSTAKDALDVLFNLDLETFDNVIINDPYDAIPSISGKYIYITSTVNNAIHTFDVGANNLLTNTATTSIPNPTKLTSTGDRLFVSHGDSDQVSVWAVSDSDPIPIEISNVPVGDNPFGIDYCEPTAVCSSQESSFR